MKQKVLERKDRVCDDKKKGSNRGDNQDKREKERERHRERGGLVEIESDREKG